MRLPPVTELATHPLWAEIEDIKSAASIHEVPGANGVNIVWRRFGTGKPLVLFHGGHGDWMHWFRNVVALSQIREVWVPDLPGFGDSGDLAEATFASLCYETLSSLDNLIGAPTTADLAGFSFGGMVAAAIAGQRPTSRITLIGSGGHRGPGREHAPLLNWKKAKSPIDRDAMLNENLRSYMLHNSGAASPLVEAIYARECRRTRFRVRGPWIDNSLQGYLRIADVRTLLLWGNRDVTLASPEAYSASLYAAGIEHELAVIPDAGHWLQCEAAECVNAAMTRFHGQVLTN